MSKFAKRIENFWYYYKWHTIAGIFLTAVLVICIIQFATRVDYDIHITYAGPSLVTADECEKLNGTVMNLTEDYNGDGKKNIDLMRHIILSDEEIAKAESEGMEVDLKLRALEIKNLSDELLVSEGYICFISSYVYERTKDTGVYENLTELLGFEPSALNDDYSINLKETGFYEYFRDSLSFLSPKTLLCFKKINVVSASNGREKQIRENHLDLFRKIVTFDN